MKQRMAVPFSARADTPSGHAAALLLDHLEVALQPVLDVGGGEIARIDQVGLDEGRRLAGALLHLAQDQQLARPRSCCSS